MRRRPPRSPLFPYTTLFRSTMFRQTARHLITTERRHPGPSANEWESRSDGWYIDTDSLPAEKRGGSVDVLTIGRNAAFFRSQRDRKSTRLNSRHHITSHCVL